MENEADRIQGKDIKALALCIGKGGRVAVRYSDNGILKVWVNEMVNFAPPDAVIYQLEDFLANWCMFFGTPEDRVEMFPGWVGNKRFVIREEGIN